MQSPNANDVIDHLAAKLSVPASHLWQVLTRQAYAQMIPDVLLAIIAGVAAFYWLKLCRAMPNWRDSDGLLVVTCILAIFVGIVIGNLCTDIGYLANPEYFALKQVLNAFKK